MIRTLIYGSCVSRDTFEYLPHGQFELLAYVARQSVVSAFADRPSPAPQAPLASPFQARMVTNDWKSSLRSQLRHEGPKADLLLWDLCDERLGFFDLGGGQVVTRSVELMGTGLANALPPAARHVDFGTEEHRNAFRSAVERFAALLRTLDLQEKVLLVAPQWAEVDESGQGGLGSFGRSAHEANELYAAYTEAAATVLGCSVVGARLQPTACSTHKWGRAPFHYSDQVYRDLAREITGALPPGCSG